MNIQLATVQPKTAYELYRRLTEVEKINLRRASPDRLHYLANNHLRVETGGSIEMISEVKRLCDQVVIDYDVQTDNGTGPVFIPSLWKY